MNERGKVGMDFDPSVLDITDEKFNEYLNDAINITIGTAGGQESFSPKVFCFSREHLGGSTFSDIRVNVFIVAGPFVEAGQKQSTMMQMGAKVRSLCEAPVAMFMASEAWIVSRTKEEAWSSTLEPRNDPKRREVLIISGRTLGGDCKAMAIVGIRRDEKGLIQLTGEKEVVSDPKVVHTGLIDYMVKGLLDLSVVLDKSAFIDPRETNGN